MDAAEAASGLNSANLNLDALWKTKISGTPCYVFSPADHMTVTCANLDGSEEFLIKKGYCYNPNIPSDGFVQDWHLCLPNEYQAAPALQTASQQQAERITNSGGNTAHHAASTTDQGEFTLSEALGDFIVALFRYLRALLYYVWTMV